MQIVTNHLQPLLFADLQPSGNGLGREAAVADGEVNGAAVLGDVSQAPEHLDRVDEVIDRYDQSAGVELIILLSSSPTS
ncbi:uncharacterized protein PG986_000661 [Apiospora aurea]|uniref:Uncharacterized protein n=1 Tax=Apiospora aurea TaxID=335848 RepID=A0ABR1QUQ4_9PEZI